MTFVFIAILAIVVVVYQWRLEGERDARRAAQLSSIGFREERDLQLEHYDHLANQYEELLVGPTHPDADVWADGAVEVDELQDALIPSHEAAELEAWIGPLDVERG